MCFGLFVYFQRMLNHEEVGMLALRYFPFILLNLVDLLRHVDLLRLFFALIIRWSCRYSVFVRNAQHRMALPYKDKIVRCIFKCISVFIYIFSKFFKSAGRWGFSHYVNSIFYSFCFNSVLPLIHISHSTDIKPLLSIFSIKLRHIAYKRQSDKMISPLKIYCKKTWRWGKLAIRYFYCIIFVSLVYYVSYIQVSLYVDRNVFLLIFYICKACVKYSTTAVPE